MKNSVLQKAVIVLHVGICIFLLLGFIEEFENGKKILLNFDLLSSSFYKTLSYCVAFLIGLFYVVDSVQRRVSNKELSILFSISILLFAALYFYIKSNTSDCTLTATERAISECIMMSSFPILFLLLSFSSLIYPLNQLDKNSCLDSELAKNDISNDCFWRIHRIFSILLSSIAFGIFISMSYDYDENFISSIIFVFVFINSILFWFLPKWGSISFSVLCLILVCGIYYLFISKPPKEIIMICVPLFMTLCFGSIPFILLNKDSRLEWKMR